MRLLVAVGAVLALSVFGIGAVAGLSTAQAAEPPIVQVCAATSIEEVDNLLNSVGDRELLESLNGLLVLDVPTRPKNVELDSSVQLDDVKKRLNCSSVIKPSTSASPTPTTVAPEPFEDCEAVRKAGLDPISKNNARFQTGLDQDGDGIGCELNGDDDKVSGGTGSRTTTKKPTDAPETGN